jgi:hypothetical protein
MSKFLTVVWNAIRDKDNVRELAIAATRKAIGALTSQGELSEKLYHECFHLLRNDGNINVTYSAITILRSLLKHGLINDHCTELVTALYNLKDHKNLSVRRAFVKIIPELATKQSVKSDTSLEHLSDYLMKCVG